MSTSLFQTKIFRKAKWGHGVLKAQETAFGFLRDAKFSRPWGNCFHLLEVLARLWGVVYRSETNVE